jgi:hypothetical protein
LASAPRDAVNDRPEGIRGARSLTRTRLLDGRGLPANKHDEESIRQVVKWLQEHGWNEYL